MSFTYMVGAQSLNHDSSFHSDKHPVHVVVDPILSKILRPHQREVFIYIYFALLYLKTRFFSLDR